MGKIATLASIVFIALSGDAQQVTTVPAAKQDREIISGHGQFWKYDPGLDEKELYNHSRLRYMSREDWDLFRQDPRYNKDKVREVYVKNRKPIVPYYEGVQTKAMMPGESCDCWIAPDVSYTILDPVTQWDNCEGGAGEGVDCWQLLDIPFDFCFYGQTYSSVYLTTKGTIALGGGYYDWTPSEFPTPTGGTEPQYNHICGFWADFDFNAAGQYFYKVTDEALYVNFVEVGYYNQHQDYLNTFQMIITADGSDILPDGNNVQFCYLDMNWAHGDVGGNSGFNGPNPANAGADVSSGTDHRQFGRFNLNNDVYNGVYGQNNAQQDGVNWLDNKVFTFNVCESANNIPPIPTAATPCDTFYVCINDTIDISTQFLAPETAQSVQISVDLEGEGLDFSTQSGNTATFNGIFVGTADNVGVHTVTVTATDNGTPQGEVEFTYIIEVLDIVLPTLSIVGPDSVCAGGITLQTASEGFDFYTWSDSDCGNGNECEIAGSGTQVNISVTGNLAGCTRTANRVLYVDPFEYVEPIVIDPNPTCPGTCSSLCAPEGFVTYQWQVFDGYPGEFCNPGPQNQPCTEVNPGTYQLFATNDNGCTEFNILVVEEIQTFIPEENEDLSTAYCNGLQPVTIDGGYSFPASGFLNIYCATGDPTGWQGSYLNVIINGETVAAGLTTLDAFEIHNVAIEFGDEICVEYVSSGVNDAFNTVYLFNCTNQDQTIIGPGLEDGEIWCATSGCEADPFVPGVWSCEGPPGWSLTNDDEYNTVFTPGAYGLYSCCFAEPSCQLEFCYEFEFTLPPTLNVLGSDEVNLCEGETDEVCVVITDIGGTGTIDWDGDVDPNADGTCATFGPYNDYENFTANVEIENGCGSAEADITVDADIAIPPLVIPPDGFFCGGQSITLDPIAPADDDANLQYEWIGPGVTGATTPTVNATQSGTYEVEVSNDCESQDGTVTFQIVAPDNPQCEPDVNILECTEGEAELCVCPNTGYEVSWSNGASTNCITVTSSGTYTWTITDSYNCNTETSGSSSVTITFAPELDPESSDLRILCPGECENLVLNPTYATSYTWTSDCDELNITGSGPQLNFCFDQVPDTCLYDQITITGTATNVCGTQSANFLLQNNQCLITIPNIFTPGGGDTLNTRFEIPGLDLYEGAALTVFDRWGSEVFQSDDYGKNNDYWRAEDVNAGTFYYVLLLPYGNKRQYAGYVTVLKSE